MYAIIEDSGSQMKVEKGMTLDIDIRDLPDSANSVTFERVLMVGGGDSPHKIGMPYLKGAKVTADIVDREFKGEKLDIRKFRRRKGYRRMQGHRQRYMKVKVTAITA